MTSKDYKAVQDAQLQYETYVQSRRFDQIVDKLLSRREDVLFSHSDLKQEVKGRSEVVRFYKCLAAAFEKNGGFLRTDLSTSQVLSFSPDGKSATGTWLTIGVECRKEAFGYTSEPYPMFRLFGQRRTQFVQEGGLWKMKEIHWQEIFRLGPIAYAQSKCTGWSGLRERCWELPPTDHSGPWKGVRCR